MRGVYIIFISVASVLVSSCSEKVSIEELKKFAATETYPEDRYLDSVLNKVAIVIVAHDDDDCAMSGTIAKLTKSGWKIKQLSFSSTRLKEGTLKHPATIICEGNELIFPNRPYRLGLDTTKYPYVPIPRKDLDDVFEKQKIKETLVNKINSLKPSVIFSLDNEIGGYGHPDHIFISQLVLDLFKNKEIICDRIYQSVYTDHMETEIVDKWLYNRMKKYSYPQPYIIAKSMYNISGMPEPTVQIDIKKQAETKMNYLQAYHEKARKNMRKFIPYFEEFDAQTYFSIFDKEFFRVLDN